VEVEDSRGIRLVKGVLLIRQMRQIKAVLPRLQKTMFWLAPLDARLAVLKAYHDEGYGRGDLVAGASTERFFQEFEKNRPQLIRDMAFVRMVTRLYAIRNRDRLFTVKAGGIDVLARE